MGWEIGMIGWRSLTYNDETTIDKSHDAMEKFKTLISKIEEWSWKKRHTHDGKHATNGSMEDTSTYLICTRLNWLEMGHDSLLE